MDVKDVMVKEIITVNPTTKIRDAVVAHRMRALVQ